MRASRDGSGSHGGEEVGPRAVLAAGIFAAGALCPLELPLFLLGGTS